MNRCFDPIQYNFDRNWLNEIMPRRKLPAFKSAFARIADSYQDIAQTKFDDRVQIDPEQAQAEYDLDLHKARVMCHNLDWLRDCAFSLDLARLCLVIAEELYPEKKWDMVENIKCVDEYIVVTEIERTMVFDLRNCHRVSGGASLVLAGDTVNCPSDIALEEANDFMRARHQLNLDAVETAKKQLEAFSKGAQVIEMEKS